MSQSNKTSPEFLKFFGSRFTRNSLKITKTESKPKKLRKTRRISKKTHTSAKSGKFPLKWNLRAKKNFLVPQPSFEKKKGIWSSKTQESLDFLIQTPRLLIKQKKLKVPMLDYSSSVEDPKDSWLWNSENEEDCKIEGIFEKKTCLTTMKTQDNWSLGDKINYRKITNITQSFADLSQSWSTIIEKDLKKDLCKKKKRKSVKVKKNKSKRKVSKQKIQKKKKKN